MLWLRSSLQPGVLQLVAPASHCEVVHTLSLRYEPSIGGEAAKLPRQSQVVGLECAGVDVAQHQVDCPSYVGFAMPRCRKRRSQRFAESSSTAPTKAELVIWS